MTKTTAASNHSKRNGTQSLIHNNFKTSFGGISSKSIGRRTAGSAVDKMTKPHSIGNKS
jgi:hypothetical protein